MYDTNEKYFSLILAYIRILIERRERRKVGDVTRVWEGSKEVQFLYDLQNSNLILRYLFLSFVDFFQFLLRFWERRRLYKER